MWKNVKNWHQLLSDPFGNSGEVLSMLYCFWKTEWTANNEMSTFFGTESILKGLVFTSKAAFGYFGQLIWYWIKGNIHKFVQIRTYANNKNFTWIACGTFYLRPSQVNLHSPVLPYIFSDKYSKCNSGWSRSGHNERGHCIEWAHRLNVQSIDFLNFQRLALNYRPWAQTSFYAPSQQNFGYLTLWYSIKNEAIQMVFAVTGN